MNNCSERYTYTARIKRAVSSLPLLSPNACCFRKLARKLREFLMISEDNPRRKIYFRSQSAVLKEKFRQAKRFQWFIIHPFSLFMKYWQIFMIFIWLTVLTNDMFSVAFRPRLRQQGYSIVVWYYFIFACNTVCCVDIIVNFVTGYVEKERGVVILDPAKIALNYTKTWLAVDLVSVFALLRMVIHHHRNTYTWKILSLLRYIRLLRIKTVLINFRWITDALQLRYGVYIILCMFIVALYVLHFNTCIYILIPDAYAKIRPETNRFSWISRIEEQFILMNKTLTAFDLYFLSLKECLLKFNTGSVSYMAPYNFEEVILSLIFLIIGYIIKIVLFIILLYLFDSQYESSCMYVAGFNQLKSFLLVKEIDKTLKHSIFIYYNFRYNNHYSDESFSDLTALLRLEVLMDIWKGELERSALFQHLPKSFIAEVAHFLRPDIFMPNYTIYTIGDIANEMYFLCTGSVAMYDNTGKETCHVCDGEIFGIGLLERYLSIRRDTAIAVEYCEVFCLHKKYLTYLCNKSVEFGEIIANLAAKISGVSLGVSHLSTPYRSQQVSEASSQPSLVPLPKPWLTSKPSVQTGFQSDIQPGLPPSAQPSLQSNLIPDSISDFQGSTPNQQSRSQISVQSPSGSQPSISAQPSVQPSIQPSNLQSSSKLPNLRPSNITGSQSSPQPSLQQSNSQPGTKPSSSDTQKR